ncbi:MAG: segregation/condensation protein A [Actinobacteria bacterium]|nr:segregation/condensation protein A [Actinomycetota bacterium]
MIEVAEAERPGSEPDLGPSPVELPTLGAPVADSPESPDSNVFSVRLDEFEGPFDLLLSLIAKHRLDVTVLAIHTVIDDFVAHIRSRGPEWDLDEATEFLVVAATLLDLKAARLLPSGEVEDEEDLALLEARDVLFARLLQYRAYRDVSAVLAEMLTSGARRHPREVGLDPSFAQLLPEVLIGLGPDEFAALAGRALAPKPVPTVSISHVHAPRVSVREQAAILVDRLRRHPSSTFRSLTNDCETTLLIVARFLALLELYREGSVAFDQLTPLGELHVRWTGSNQGDIALQSEEYEGAPEPEAGDALLAESVTDETLRAALAASGFGNHRRDGSNETALESPHSPIPPSRSSTQEPV